MTPRLAGFLLARMLRADLRDDVLGDLEEGFRARVAGSGRSAARLWYWRQTIRSLPYAGTEPDSAPDPRPHRRIPRLQRAFMGFLRYDLGYAFRQLRSNPGFTAVAVLSLALGIGVNATIFTIINGFLLEPLPVNDIDRVVEIFGSTPSTEFGMTSWPDYVEFREAAEGFDGVAAEMTMIFNWNRDTHSEMVFGSMVSGNYFSVLGIDPAHGRWFAPEESRTPRTHPVVVLDHGFWERHFGGDPAVVGQTMKFNGHPFTIVGVAPGSFTGTIPVVHPDVWVPLMVEPLVNFFTPDDSILEQRGTRSLRLFGRLSADTGIEQARSQLQTVAARLAAAYPETNENRSAAVKWLSEIRLHPNADSAVTPIAVLLMGLVGLVLLVACANVANMLLARASARTREIGVRMALGAGRWRLMRQLLTESVILSLLGGAVGLLMTYWITRLLVRVQPSFPISVVLDISPDARVLAFTFLASLLTGVTFGLLPALRSSNPDLVRTLKHDHVGGGGRFNLRNGLVVAQIAVSLVLLVTAGLFARSLGNAQAIDLGFDEENVAFVSTSLGAAGYEQEPGRRLLRDVTERISALPGVRSAAYTARLPMNMTNVTMEFVVEGYEPDDGEAAVSVQYNTVGPRYFETLRIPMRAGREIAATDDNRAPLVAVVNESFVNEYWPSQSPLGKRLRFDGDAEPWIEVVGVSADYKMQTVGEPPRPMVHTSLMQQMPFFETIMVRVENDPARMVTRLREELTAADTNISFFDARTLRDNLAVALFPVRMGAAMLAVFGFLALGLAAVGVYGVIAYAVTRRTHEIGVRMALGAEARDVLGLVIRQGMTTVGIGVALGVLGALALSTLLGGWLYVSPVDPVAFVGTVVVLLGVALLANYIPARRGANVDPIIALRSE